MEIVKEATVTAMEKLIKIKRENYKATRDFVNEAIGQGPVSSCSIRGRGAANQIRAIPPSLRSYGRTGARLRKWRRILGPIHPGRRARRFALALGYFRSPLSGLSVCGFADSMDCAQNRVAPPLAGCETLDLQGRAREQSVQILQNFNAVERFEDEDDDEDEKDFVFPLPTQ